MVAVILAFVAGRYFSGERRPTLLHRTFSALLAAALVHLALDAATLYTVHHLTEVPRPVNDLLHRLFVGSMVVVICLFYRYIAILVEEETGKPRRLDLAACVFLAAAELAAMALPVQYAVTPQGNYADGLQANVCYASTAFYLLLCAWLLAANWRQLAQRERRAIGAALCIELIVCVLQGLHRTWLISGMGITL